LGASRVGQESDLKPKALQGVFHGARVIYGIGQLYTWVLVVPYHQRQAGLTEVRSNLLLGQSGTRQQKQQSNMEYPPH